jgi:hypothetical protein
MRLYQGAKRLHGDMLQPVALAKAHISVVQHGGPHLQPVPNLARGQKVSQGSLSAC